MRYIIALLLFLAVLLTPGCKKSRTLPALDWDNRPASCVDEIYPVGRWAEPVKVYVDTSQIYYHPGDTPVTFITGWVREDYPAILETWQDYCAKLGVPFEVVTDRDQANVCIAFYFGPYVAGRIGSGLVLIPDDKQALAMARSYPSTIPPSGNNWNGVCYISPKRGVIRGAQCWINVYAATLFANNRNSWRQYLEGISNHEAGHWRMGLNDDEVHTAPGMMHYRHMTAWPQLHEEELVQWMYPAKAAKGLACGGD